MAENAVAGIDIVARLDAFRAELAKIPDIGADQAKALTAALGKEIKGATAATKDATKATRDHTAALKNQGKATKDATQEVDKSAKSMKDLKEASGDTGSAAGKLAGILDRIAPGAGDAAIAVNDLADASEVASAAAGAAGVSVGALAAVLAPIAAIAAAGYLAIGHFRDKAEEMGERAEEAGRRLAKMIEGLQGILDLEKDLDVRELKLVDPEAARHLEATRTAAEKFAPQVGAVKDAIGEESSALRESQRELAAKEQAYADLAAQADRAAQASATGLKVEKDSTQQEEARARALGEAQAAIVRAGDAVADHQAQIEAYNNQLTDLNAAQGALASRLILVADGEDRARDATKGAAEAQRDAAEAARERAQNEALLEQMMGKVQAREATRRTDLAKAVDALHKAHDAALSSVATEEERIHLAAQAAREAAVSAANEAQAKVSADAAGAEERKRIARELRETLAAINEDEIQDVLAAEKKKQAAAQATADKIEASAFSSASSLSGAIASVADTVSQAAERQGEDSEKLAKVAFGVSKGAAIAQATIGTAKAALDAYDAALMLGPPGLVLAPIAAGAAAAVGVAQIAAIAATPPPSFEDTPGIQRMGRGGLVQLAPGDSYAAARDPEKLKRTVTSTTPNRRSGVSPIVVVQQAGSVVDERVTRIRRGAPSELSRGLDRAAGNTVAKRRRRT